MKLSEISFSRFAHLTRSDGIFFQVGPFYLHLRTSIQNLAKAIHLHYADFRFIDDGFVDFHIRIPQPLGFRRFWRPQALFEFDGYRPFQPYPIQMAMPLFEWGLNWCIGGHSHQFLLIHSAVVEKDGMGIIMPAPPGSGKSTLCAALSHRGWRLLSDEFAIINIDDRSLIPLVRPISLKNDSIEIINKYASDAYLGPTWSFRDSETICYIRPPQNAVENSDHTAMPAWVIFPRYKSRASLSLQPKSKAHSLYQLAKNSYNYNLLGADGFNALADVIDACDCYDLTYSHLDEAIECFNSLSPPNRNRS